MEAIEHIRGEMTDIPLETFEADWRKRWLVERGVEIISEASRHLPVELKNRHPEIPWPKVAGIGNVLRHGLVREDLPPLEKAAREELTAARARE